MSTKPLVFSFFSGAGFLDLGFEKNGFEIAYVNEIHTPFLEAYKHSRLKLNIPPPKYGYHNGDIGELLSKNSNTMADLMKNAKLSSDLVGFIGGPPCPDFSVGGKNKGENGENGKLSKTYVQLICEQKPDFFIFENVKGLYRTAKHRAFFDTLKKMLAKAGYKCTERLINSIEYGVPQDRERIILFGTRDKGIEKFNWNLDIKFPDRSAFDHEWPDTAGEEWNLLNHPNIPRELMIEHWFKNNDVTNHPNSLDYFTPRAGLVKFQTIVEGDVSRKSYKRLHRWRYSPTAAYGNNEVHIHPILPRRISVSEALAIQSLPKEFELPESMSLTNMFKTVGNGVPFLAAKGIASSVKDFLGA
ncbi:DNA cytosine methyltransferase [Methylophilus glucosoxydans]|uniref:DNA (cytosine-5-)-methyltransferase n=1 Tax=Methylophilus glucosoxydans TaxID=752553 RepID=A0ABW3GHX4_9PROT